MTERGSLEGAPEVPDPAPERTDTAKPGWVEDVLGWASSNSLWPLILGMSAGATEWLATLTPRYDWARFGSEVFRSSPRQADLMVVNGPVTYKMAPRLVRIWQQMADPKYVIAFGSEAISGGIHSDSYNVVPGVDELLPVDVYVPGSPPRPEALLNGLIRLQDKITGEGRNV